MKDGKSLINNLYILQCEILLKIEDISKSWLDRNIWNNI